MIDGGRPKPISGCPRCGLPQYANNAQHTGWCVEIGELKERLEKLEQSPAAPPSLLVFFESPDPTRYREVFAGARRLEMIQDGQLVYVYLAVPIP